MVEPTLVRRTATVTISCSESQKDDLQAAAEHYGWTLTDYVLRRLGVEPWPDGVPPPSARAAE